MSTTTIIPKPKFIHPSVVADEFQKVLKQVEDDAYGAVTLPCDPHDRMVAINAIHDILDRLWEATANKVKELERKE